MYYNDHEPPHIHVRCAGDHARFTIEPPAFWDGVLSVANQRKVLAWMDIHQDELRENWALVLRHEPLRKIASP
jgi:hypothetical protein